MLKTIKTTKYLNLHELIKYVWENSVNEKRVFLGNHGQRVVFDNVGGFYPSGYAYSPDTTFSVEIKEEITEETVFERCVVLLESGATYTPTRCNIKYIEENYVQPIQVFARVDGKLKLIWERED